MAAAAVSFLAFCFGKARHLDQMQGQVVEAIEKIIADKMKLLLSSSSVLGVKKFASKIGGEGFVNAAMSGNLKDAALLAATHNAQTVMRNSPLGDTLDSLHLDPQTCVKLVAYDAETIKEVSNEWGMDEAILRILVAIGSMDWPQVETNVITLVEEVCAVEPVMAKSILSLARTGVSSGRSLSIDQLKLVVKGIFNHVMRATTPEQQDQVVRMFLSQFHIDLPASASPTGVVDFVTINEYLDVLSDTLSSLLSLISGDTKPLAIMISSLGVKLPEPSFQLRSSTDSDNDSEDEEETKADDTERDSSSSSSPLLALLRHFSLEECATAFDEGAVGLDDLMETLEVGGPDALRRLVMEFTPDVKTGLRVKFLNNLLKPDPFAVLRPPSQHQQDSGVSGNGSRPGSSSSVRGGPAPPAESVRSRLGETLSKNPYAVPLLKTYNLMDSFSRSHPRWTSQMAELCSSLLGVPREKMEALILLATSKEGASTNPKVSLRIAEFASDLLGFSHTGLMKLLFPVLSGHLSQVRYVLFEDSDVRDFCSRYLHVDADLIAGFIGFCNGNDVNPLELAKSVEGFKFKKFREMGTFPAVNLLSVDRANMEAVGEVTSKLLNSHMDYNLVIALYQVEFFYEKRVKLSKAASVFMHHDKSKLDDEMREMVEASARKRSLIGAFIANFERSSDHSTMNARISTELCSVLTHLVTRLLPGDPKSIKGQVALEAKKILVALSEGRRASFQFIHDIPYTADDIYRLLSAFRQLDEMVLTLHALTEAKSRVAAEPLKETFLQDFESFSKSYYTCSSVPVAATTLGALVCSEHFIRELLILRGCRPGGVWLENFLHVWFLDCRLRSKMVSRVGRIADQLGIPIPLYRVIGKVAFYSDRKLKFDLRTGAFSSLIGELLASMVQGGPQQVKVVQKCIDAVVDISTNPTRANIFWQLYHCQKALRPDLFDHERSLLVETVHAVLRRRTQSSTNGELMEILMSFFLIRAYIKASVEGTTPAEVLYRLEGEKQEFIKSISDSDTLRYVRGIMTVLGLDKDPNFITTIAELTGVNPATISLFVGTATGDVKQVDSSLTTVLQHILNDDEGVCKGLVGVFRGDVSAVEDFVRALNLDVDTCDALMTLSVGEFSQIRTSDTIRKIEPQLGVEVGTIVKLASVIRGTPSQMMQLLSAGNARHAESKGGVSSGTITSGTEQIDVGLLGYIAGCIHGSIEEITTNAMAFTRACSDTRRLTLNQDQLLVFTSLLIGDISVLQGYTEMETLSKNAVLKEGIDVLSTLLRFAHFAKTSLDYTDPVLTDMFRVIKLSRPLLRFICRLAWGSKQARGQIVSSIEKHYDSLIKHAQALADKRSKPSKAWEVVLNMTGDDDDEDDGGKPAASPRKGLLGKKLKLNAKRVIQAENDEDEKNDLRASIPNVEELSSLERTRENEIRAVEDFISQCDDYRLGVQSQPKDAPFSLVDSSLVNALSRLFPNETSSSENQIALPFLISFFVRLSDDDISTFAAMVGPITNLKSKGFQIACVRLLALVKQDFTMYTYMDTSGITMVEELVPMWRKAKKDIRPLTAASRFREALPTDRPNSSDANLKKDIQFLYDLCARQPRAFQAPYCPLSKHSKRACSAILALITRDVGILASHMDTIGSMIRTHASVLMELILTLFGDTKAMESLADRLDVDPAIAGILGVKNLIEDYSIHIRESMDIDTIVRTSSSSSPTAPPTKITCRRSLGAENQRTKDSLIVPIVESSAEEIK